jgi:hypothetical protein
MRAADCAWAGRGKRDGKIPVKTSEAADAAAPPTTSRRLIGRSRSISTIRDRAAAAKGRRPKSQANEMF